MFMAWFLPTPQLGFALLLKFYGRFGRFPRGRSELHDDAVAFVAGQLGVSAGSLGFYEWSGQLITDRRPGPDQLIIIQHTRHGVRLSRKYGGHYPPQTQRNPDQYWPRTINRVPGSARDPQPARRVVPDLGQRIRVYLVTAVLPTPQMALMSTDPDTRTSGI